MNLQLKLILLTLVLFILRISYSGSRPLQLADNKLNLTDLGMKIENSISIKTTKSNYESIKAISGRKVSVKASSLIINGDTLDPEEISTRGQSTLNLRRKSYSFSLTSKASFQHGKRAESFKKFFVLGLSMDKNYSCNRLAFQMMETFKLFNLFYAFCELRINGESEGICMVIERPDDWAMKEKDSPLLIRRGYENTIHKLKTGKKTGKDETEKFRGYYVHGYRSLNKYKGEELYNVLSGWLDIDEYMKWLAFNFFVRNGDYTDEVYFYYDPALNKFRIIPWDYDDLFSAAPHEGMAERREIIGAKLFFSTEDLLDNKIVTDPYLYNKYLIQFRELMNQLSADVLRSAFENTYAELYPYYSNSEILSKSMYDIYKETNLIRLNEDMSFIYEEL